MYRPSKNPPQTAWARHLDQVLRDRDWSRVQLFEAIGAELGYGPKSRSAMLPLLVDLEPNPAQVAVLREHFGEPPVGLTPEPPEPEPSLAAALKDLVAELRDAREQRESTETRLRAVEAELQSLRAQLGAAGSPTRSVLPGRAE